jgi:hypothetical protein
VYRVFLPAGEAAFGFGSFEIFGFFALAMSPLIRLARDFALGIGIPAIVAGV